MRLFNSFVHIQRHPATELAIDKEIDKTIPRRCIRRRHSVLNVAEEAQIQNVDDVAEQVPEQVRAKKRRFSVDARTYLAPPEVRSAIDSFRQKDGVVKYHSSFHSVQQKTVQVVAIGNIPVASTNINMNPEDRPLSKISTCEQNVHTIADDNTVDDETFMDIGDVSFNVNETSHEIQSSDFSMQNVVASIDTNTIVNTEPLTLAQMEENIRQMRIKLGNFDSVLIFITLTCKLPFLKQL